MSDTKSAETIGSSTVVPLPKALDVNFIKSSQFRVIHASGVWYGGDAQKNLHLTFFNERSAIPRKIVLNLNEKGEIVGEDASQRDSKEGIIREMEVDVILSFQAAMELYNSLGENLKVIQENLRNESRISK